MVIKIIEKEYTVRPAMERKRLARGSKIYEYGRVIVRVPREFVGKKVKVIVIPLSE